MIHFTCEVCHRWTTSSVEGTTKCRDCRKRHPKRVQEISGGRWLEWSERRGRRMRDTLLFLDLIDRRRPEKRDRSMLHFVWDVWGVPPDSGMAQMWYGGMIKVDFPVIGDALVAANAERDRTAQDIADNIYRDWVVKCPVCNVDVEVHTFEEPYFKEFFWSECPTCHRRWEKWDR